MSDLASILWEGGYTWKEGAWLSCLHPPWLTDFPSSNQLTAISLRIISGRKRFTALLQQ